MAKNPEEPDVSDSPPSSKKPRMEVPEVGPPKPGGTRAYRKKFDTCVKAVRKTVRARKGSNKESAAIAICTKNVLQTRGRTMKKYRKGRLITQKF